MSWSLWSSSSTVLHFPRLSLFLVLLFLLFSSLSFFVVDGVGENDDGGDGGNENDELIFANRDTIGVDTSPCKGERLKTIEIELQNSSSGNDNGTDTTTTYTFVTNPTQSESEAQKVQGESSSPTTSPNSAKNLDWQRNWDPDWGKEVAAGLATMSIISDGRLTSAFLSHGVLGRFLFMNDDEGNWISFTVIPCTSVIHWSVRFNDDDSNFFPQNNHILKTFRTDETVSFNKTNCRRGIHALEIRPVLADTYIHFYVTTKHFEDPGVALSTTQIPADNDGQSFTYNFLSSPAITRRQGISAKKLRGGRLSVRWEGSPMNPQTTHYCIVVNTRKDYSSLCGAQGERYGVIPPDLMHLPYYQPYKRFIGADKNNTANDIRTMRIDNNWHKKSHSQAKVFDDIILGCLKRRKSYILSDIREGQLYYFNVFVKNTLTNLSYPYLRTTLQYRQPKIDSANVMRDSKPYKINLPEKVDNASSSVLKFNLKKPCLELIMYAMICSDGSFFYQVFNGNRNVYNSEEVTSLDIIKIARPLPGKYTIKIRQATNPNDGSQHKIKRKAEFLVSKRHNRFPLPRLPDVRKIVEDTSQRTCDSVTIQWWPSPGPRDTEYCIYLKKESRRRTFNFKEPIQCDLERSLQNDRYITHSFCLQRTATTNEYANLQSFNHFALKREFSGAKHGKVKETATKISWPSRVNHLRSSTSRAPSKRNVVVL